MRFSPKKIIKIFAKWLNCAACNLTCSFLVLFLISLIIGFLVFYFYGFLPEKKEFEDLDFRLELNEQDYFKVLEIWQKKEESFNRADNKDCPKLFETFFIED